MNTIIDILTPKQGMFFNYLSNNLEAKGYRVIRTTRKYREVNQLLKIKGLEAKIVGEHGGGSKINKLKASAQRTIKLVSLFEKFEPDIAVSFSSPEMARVSYGLGVPHLCINDSPHAKAVARLTIPLSTKLLTPKIIPKKVWIRYGISPDRIVQYNALDPWVWLKDFRPDQRILQQLGLDESKPILTFRTEESFAAYLLGKTKKDTSVIPMIKKVLKKERKVQVVAIPRYEAQKTILQKVFKNQIVTCGSAVDGPSLLYYTSVFIGGGGTMTTEAALLGVPTISYYPDDPFIVLKYLTEKGLVTHSKDPEKISKRIITTLKNFEMEKERQKERVKKLVKNFEDPIKTIISEIECLV